MIRPNTRTEVLAINHRDDGMVDLTLGRPNCSITLPLEQARMPWAVQHKIRVQFGSRYDCFGRAFDDDTRGRCQKAWLTLFEQAPMGINGVFSTLCGQDHTLNEVLKNGTA